MKLKTILLASTLALPLLSNIIAEFPSTPWNDQDWVEKEISIVNTSEIPHYVWGIRFQTKSDVWNGSSQASISSKGKNGGFEVEMLLKNTEINFNGNDTLTFGVFGSPGGKDGSPTDPSFLIQNGSHFWPLEIPYAEPIVVSQIDSLMNSDDFYNESLGILDTLGQRGGPQNGGMIDTWYGLTQLQSALPTEPFNQNATWMTFEPKAYGNALYMMTLAAMQEYFNIDMQVLIAKGGKENMAGMVQWDSNGSGPTKKLNPIYGTGNNGLSGVDFSPFSVEYQTFNDYVFNSYPKFFPMGNNTGTRDYFATTSGSGGYCDLDKANVVNGTIIACLYNWFTYQIALHATDYGFNEMIERGKDPQGPLKLALWAFNRGITCGFEQTVANEDALTYDKIEEYPSIASNGKIYIEGIVQALNPIVEAARNSENLGGTKPIYDDTISLALIEEFLFGSNGRGSTGDRGEGGLLAHFSLTVEQMSSLWSEVESAFLKLKGNAPSTEEFAEQISYRYDWLTILRVIKGHINTEIPLPTTYKFVSWEKSKSSKSTTFSGENRDTEFPTSQVIDINHEEALILTVKAQDNQSVKSVTWSLDSNLVHWTEGVEFNGNWKLILSNQVVAEHIIDDSVTVHILTTDEWGGAELRSITVEHDASTSIEGLLKSYSTRFTLSARDKTVNLSIPDDGARFSLFTLQGREVLQQSVQKGEHCLHFPSLTSGVYIASVQLTSGQSISQVTLLR